MVDFQYPISRSTIIQIEISVESMPEYGWSRISVNVAGLLKVNYGRVSLEYAWICLKYNLKVTVKLL